MALYRRCPIGPSGIISLSQPSQVLQGYPLCRLLVPSCDEWTAVVVGVLVGEVGPQAGFPVTAADTLVGGVGPWSKRPQTWL